MDFSITPVTANYLKPTQVELGVASDVGEVSQTSMPSPALAAVPAYKPIQDTVKLSTTSQVQSLKQSGASVSQIAANLGLTAAEVDQDLGITASSSSSESSVLTALSAKK